MFFYTVVYSSIRVEKLDVQRQKYSVCFKPNCTFDSSRGQWHALWLVRRLSAGAKNPEECERGAVEMLGLSQLIAFILLPCFAFFLVTSTLFELIVTILLPCVVNGHHWRFGCFWTRGVCSFKFQIAQIEIICVMIFISYLRFYKGITY